jgi:MFS transporter, DHA1 family, tetracycline resistance protein
MPRESAPASGNPGARRSPLLVVFLTVFIDLLGFGIVIPLLPIYSKAHGAGELELGLLFASFSGMQFFFAPMWGRISDAGRCSSAASSARARHTCSSPTRTR